MDACHGLAADSKAVHVHPQTQGPPASMDELLGAVGNPLFLLLSHFLVFFSGVVVAACFGTWRTDEDVSRDEPSSSSDTASLRLQPGRRQQSTEMRAAYSASNHHTSRRSHAELSRDHQSRRSHAELEPGSSSSAWSSRRDLRGEEGRPSSWPNNREQTSTSRYSRSGQSRMQISRGNALQGMRETADLSLPRHTTRRPAPSALRSRADVAATAQNLPSPRYKNQRPVPSNKRPQQQSHDSPHSVLPFTQQSQHSRAGAREHPSSVQHDTAGSSLLSAAIHRCYDYESGERDEDHFLVRDSSMLRPENRAGQNLAGLELCEEYGAQELLGWNATVEPCAAARPSSRARRYDKISSPY
jgi:hypothetical protein